jgi:hypothetical protein
MMNKKFIVCENCKYFPNKADQIKNHEIRVELDQIKWKCGACFQFNLYPGSYSIFLPEVPILCLGSDNLLKKEFNHEEFVITIIVDLDSFEPSTNLYVPHCK